jgi:hypothetical protein
MVQLLCMMDWEGRGKKGSWIILIYRPGISLEGKRKTTWNLSKVVVVVVVVVYLTTLFQQLRLYSVDF